MRTTEADPFTTHEPVTLSDSADIAMRVCRGFYASAAGDVKVTDASGVTLTLPVQAGLNPSKIRRFWATGTDGGLTIVAAK